MPQRKWLVVARNEYRITTSGIRRIRPYLLYLAAALLAVWVAYIAPMLVGFFVDELVAFFLSQVAVAVVQILLFMLFFFFIIWPISSALKEEVHAGQLEIFLAAPVKPSDILLGKFLGVIPFYGIAIVAIAGFFTAALGPLGLDIAQMAVIIVIFVATFSSALWIGTVITAILRTKLGRTARGKDIGRALSLVLALPMIVFMYSIMGGGLLEALADPGTGGLVRAVLGVLPSSWGAEVIVGFAANPGNILAVGSETLARFGGLVAFFVGALWLGAKAADRAYSLEPTTFTASTAKPDGAFYKAVRSLGGGGSFGALLVSVFKDDGRRLENLSRIAYIMGLFVLMTVFLADPGDLMDVPIYALLMLPMLGAFVVGDVTLRGKEALFIYKKAPSGVGRLIKARLVQGWLVVVPVAAAITAVTAIMAPQPTFISLLSNVGLLMLAAAASVPFALGLFLRMPAFSQQSLGLNATIVMMVSMGLFVVSALVLDLPLLYIPLIWVVGIVFLYLGKRNLSRIE